MKHSDQIILTGIINGDEKILTRFYKENIRYVKGYILRNYGNTEDVEDVFQDALVVLFQKMKSDLLKIHVPLKTYFYGICKNLWRNRLRKKKRLIMENNEMLYENQRHIEEGDNDSIMADMENKDREHLYRKHFQKLSNDNRKLLHLFFEGKSMKEISVLTGYTEAYTRKKKFLVKKQLLEMIEEDPMYDELRAFC